MAKRRRSYAIYSREWVGKIGNYYASRKGKCLNLVKLSENRGIVVGMLF
jgi:hypothetical protein